MKFYAIRQKSTGLFMPAGRGRGYTHDEPTAVRPPRLFNRERDAAAALRCWLLGDWKEETSTDMYGEPDGIYPIPPKERNPDRKAKDMEVVEVALRVRVRT